MSATKAQWLEIRRLRRATATGGHAKPVTRAQAERELETLRAEFIRRTREWNGRVHPRAQDGQRPPRGLKEISLKTR